MPSSSNSAAPRRGSLRRRLLNSLLVTTLGLWIVGGAAHYRVARQQSRELLDASMGSTANLLLRLVQHEVGEHGMKLGAELIGAETARAPTDLRLQLWLRPQASAPAQLLFRSQRTPATALQSGDGYGWQVLDGTRWRTFALWNADHTLQVQLAESLQRQRAYDLRLLWWLCLAAMLLWPTTAALVWWIIKRSLKPLELTAEAVATRTTDDLRPIVPTAGAPAEVLPLLGELNRLLDRVRNALTYERQFTADAAHELRTPLAAIRAHAQVLRGARSDQEREGAAGDVMAGVDRGGRVVDQLLALARVDEHADLVADEDWVDLEELIRSQCDLQADFAAAQGVALGTELSAARIHGNWANLAMLLRNLIDNALRYTPRGGAVSVGCRRTDSGVELWVQDNGLGIPEPERERVFERFYRLPGQEQFGSGLGLSIVRRIAELYGATVVIEDANPGARFIVRFG